MSPAILWERLRSEGLVEGDQPPPHEQASAWYVRTMLGIAGWIGALFLIAFVGAAFASIMDSAGSAMFLGALCCAAAFALFQAFDGNDFAEQFGLAVSLAGQALIAVGLGQALDAGEPPFYFALGLVEALLAVIIPNFLHRLLAAAASALAAALGIAQLSLHGLAAPILCLAIAFVWIEPRRWAVEGNLWRPVGYGLALALLLAETFRLFDANSWLGISGGDGVIAAYAPLAGRFVTAAILVWVAFVTARRIAPPLATLIVWMAGAAALTFGLLGLAAPGLASAILILLLGFAAGNRLLTGLGILSLLGFVSHFYYSLHATLLEKSGLLAVTGALLLVAWAALRREAPSEPGHA